MDHAKHPCQGMHGISVDDKYLPDFDFADDICLLEDNAEDDQRLLESVVCAAKNVGLKIGAPNYAPLTPTSISPAPANNWRD